MTLPAYLLLMHVMMPTNIFEGISADISRGFKQLVASGREMGG